MARHFYGTTNDDTATGSAFEINTFSDFGIGTDRALGGYLDDTFILSVDEKTDTIWGGSGEDRIDYSASDRALTIDLAAGQVTAVFGGGLSQVLHVGVVANLREIEDVTGSNSNDTITGTVG